MQAVGESEASGSKEASKKATPEKKTTPASDPSVYDGPPPVCDKCSTTLSRGIVKTIESTVVCDFCVETIPVLKAWSCVPCELDLCDECVPSYIGEVLPPVAKVPPPPAKVSPPTAEVPPPPAKVSPSTAEVPPPTNTVPAALQDTPSVISEKRMLVLQNLKRKLQTSIDDDEKLTNFNSSRALTTAQDPTFLTMFLSNAASLTSMHHLQLGEQRAERGEQRLALQFQIAQLRADKDADRNSTERLVLAGRANSSLGPAATVAGSITRADLKKELSSLLTDMGVG